MAFLEARTVSRIAVWSLNGLLLPACSSNSVTEAVNGTYSLVSATLRSSSRVQLIECAGDFKLALKVEQSDPASQSIMKVQPRGSTLCRSRNPASFEESLGGDCTLGEILFTKNVQGTGYRFAQNLDQSWQCSPKSFDKTGETPSDKRVLLFDSNSQMTIQAISADTIVLNHSSQNIEYSTEFIFRKSAE